MDGEVGPVTSNLLLALHTADGYVDDGKPAADLGYLYKVRCGMQAGACGMRCKGRRSGWGL